MESTIKSFNEQLLIKHYYKNAALKMPVVIDTVSPEDKKKEMILQKKQTNVDFISDSLTTLGLSRKDFAAKLGIKQSQMYNWLSGKGYPPKSILDKIRSMVQMERIKQDHIKKRIQEPNALPNTPVKARIADHKPANLAEKSARLVEPSLDISYIPVLFEKAKIDEEENLILSDSQNVQMVQIKLNSYLKGVLIQKLQE